MAYRCYLRVSTSDQKAGLDAQRDSVLAACRMLSKLAAPDVALYVDEGVSGGKPWDQRPAMADLLSDLEEGDVLVVQRRDRLARDVLQACLIESLVAKSGARIESVEAPPGDGPEARLMRTIIDAFAEYERAMIALRTRRAKRAMAKRGLSSHGGHEPWGFRRGEEGQLVVHEQEQRLAWLLCRMRREEFCYREMLEWVELMCLPPRGERWHRATLQKIVTAWGPIYERMAADGFRPVQASEAHAVRDVPVG